MGHALGGNGDINSPTGAVDNNPPILGNGYCHLTNHPPHFLRQCTDQPGRVSPHKTARSISSLQCALSDSQFCHWLPLFSLRTPHLPPPRLLMASIAFNNRGLTGLDKGSWELPAQDGQTYHKLGLACHLNVQLKIYVRDPFGTPGHVKSQL